MSDTQEQPDWWQAADGRWYPPPGDPHRTTPGPIGGQPPPPFGQAWNPPPGMYLDPESGLTLPEGVMLASVGRRVAAFFLGIVLAIFTLGIGYVIWGLLVWGGGQTPTFQVMGMRCWRPETGRVAGFWWMALREIGGRILEDVLAIFTLLFSLILMLVTRRRQSLHDLIAGTVVLRDPNGVLRP